MRNWAGLLMIYALAVAGCANAPQRALRPLKTAQLVKVVVSCMIEVSGLPDHCQVLSNTGGPDYAASTLSWLNGPNPPRYKPEMKNGIAAPVRHEWQITYKPQPD